MTFFFDSLSSQRQYQLGLLAMFVAICLILVTVGHDWMFWRTFHSFVIKPSALNKTFKSFTVSDQVSNIAHSHLFGIAPLDQSVMPGTALQAELTGVIVATSNKFSEAIISIANQPSRVYRMGDTLPNMNVQVHAILHDSVILNNGGHLEKLSLQRTSPQFYGLPKPE